MSILGRMTRRNILGKPMRSFAIIIALAASAFALLLCIGGRDAPEQQIRNMLLNIYGGAEIQVIDANRNLEISEKDLPEGSRYITFTTWMANAKTSKGEYAVKTTWFDPEKGAAFGFFDTKPEPGDGAVISEEFAKKAGLKAGDTVKLSRETDPEKGKENKKPAVKELSVKVSSISSDKYFRSNKTVIFMSEKNVQKLGNDGTTGRLNANIDIPNDLDVKDTAKALQQKYPDYSVSELMTDQVLDDINNQTMVFVLIFAVILMMTLFLTFSMSKHIANERISAIGTLRSLGGSIPKTSAVLLTESGIYGLVGGILGAVLFLAGGKFAIETLFGFVPDDWSMELYMYPVAVVFTIAIQMLCQAGALIKAVKTPVRDIIFSSRDTAYRLSPVKIIIGAVILAAGIVVGLLADNIVLSIAAIAFISIGAVTVLPLFLKGVSKVLARLFSALGMPCAKLAANECSYKKSTVASTQLTFVSLAITIAIFITSMSVSQLYKPDIYNMDAMIELGYNTEKADKFIHDTEEIKEYEYLYQNFTDAEVNGKKKTLVGFVAYGDFKLYSGISGLGEEPEANEAYIGEGYAKQLGVKAGDTVEIKDLDKYTVNDNGTEEYSTYKFKVKGLCSTLYHYNACFVVNKKWFIDNMSDLVDNIYINLRSPEDIDKVTSEVERLFRSASVETRESLVRNSEENSRSIRTVLYSMIGIGCILALLGAVSNAIIGFEQSRKKYAVLHSIAASKKKLSKLIILETLISSVTAGILALFMGVLLTSLVETALAGLDIGVEVVFDLPLIIIFITGQTASLLLASVKPISSLKKMNTAAELKYE
ncbi:ABC-type transport system, involved in lipoprotein release, permease component [Ruminococcaceae bacterium FB2012]|nr:ABC-type transport system, involved in lipoprotein release, permease component [Ruminococcaceae bacterium FB2012]